MAGNEIKISESNPFEDTLFLIHTECHRPNTTAVGKMRNISVIMEAFNDTLKTLQEKKPIALQNWPTGVED